MTSTDLKARYHKSRFPLTTQREDQSFCILADFYTSCNLSLVEAVSFRVAYKKKLSYFRQNFWIIKFWTTIINVQRMIRRVLIVIAILAIATESSASVISRFGRSTDNCGVPKIKTGLIVRGQSFPRGTFPWIVALLHTGFNPPKFFCAGTLISRTFVVSGNWFVPLSRKASTYIPL